MGSKLPDGLDTEARLCDLVERVGALRPARRRLMVAVAGPPGSGKTTLSLQLAAALREAGHTAQHVPMDGFHLDNAVLEARGSLARKGAPHTYDAAGFVHAMRRIAEEDEVILPDFDRSLEKSIAGRIVIRPETEIAVIEGNYLCLDVPPWNALQALWDLTVFLRVDPAVLRERLLERWRGFGYAPAEALRKAEGNDLPNAETILSQSFAADVTYED